MTNFLFRRSTLALIGLGLALVAFIALCPKSAQQWQTLIAGSFAILAALIGGGFLNTQIQASEALVNKQIRASEDLENVRRCRKFAAARAVLPLTLSSLCEYARRSAVALKKILGQRRGELILGEINLPEFPSLPTEVIKELREVIEFGDDKISEAIESLLREIQVQAARLNNLWQEKSAPEKKNTSVVDVEEYVLDTASIYARSSALFDYARKESDIVPGDPPPKKNVSALNQMGLWESDFKRIHETAWRRGARAR